MMGEVAALWNRKPKSVIGHCTNETIELGATKWIDTFRDIGVNIFPM